MTPTRRLTYYIQEQLEKATGGKAEEPELRTAKGYWSHAKQDVMPLQGYCVIDGHEYSFGSWANTTTLLRKGIVVQDCRLDDRRIVDFELREH